MDEPQGLAQAALPQPESKPELDSELIEEEKREEGKSKDIKNVKTGSASKELPRNVRNHNIVPYQSYAAAYQNYMAVAPYRVQREEDDDPAEREHTLTHLLSVFNIDTQAQNYSDEMPALATHGHFDSRGLFYFDNDLDSRHGLYTGLVMIHRFDNPMLRQIRGRPHNAGDVRFARGHPHRAGVGGDPREVMVLQEFTRLSVAEPRFPPDMRYMPPQRAELPPKARAFVRYRPRGEATFSTVPTVSVAPNRRRMPGPTGAAGGEGGGPRPAGAFGRSSGAIPMPDAQARFPRPAPRYHLQYNPAVFAEQMQRQRAASLLRPPRIKRDRKHN